MNVPDRPGRGRGWLTLLILVAAAAAVGSLEFWRAPGPGAWISVAAVLSAAVLAILRVWDHYRLQELRRVAIAYAAGNHARRAAISGVDALAWLGSDLNTLGERLDQAARQVEEHRRLLDGAIGSLAEGVACVSSMDRVLYANPAWRHLAAGGSEVAGTLFYEHVAAAGLSALVARARSSHGSEQGASVEFDHRRRRIRATVAWLDADVQVIVLHDITELTRLEGARRDFVASISHELKTPLTAIAGFTETLLDGTLEEDPAVARDFVGKIARHADRLTVLVKDVLTLSRLEQGAWQVQPAAVDIAEVGRQLVEAHQAAAAERGVRVSLEAPESLPAVIDRELVQQMLGNLLSNAIRYNRPDGQVGLRLAGDAERLRFEVSDTGIGIAPEHRERVFERFYRIDAHRSRASGGSGLGLAIVKQLVETMQGSIALESGPGGTTFRVDLPRSDPRAGRG